MLAAGRAGGGGNPPSRLSCPGFRPTGPARAVLQACFTGTGGLDAPRHGAPAVRARRAGPPSCPSPLATREHEGAELTPAGVTINSVNVLQLAGMVRGPAGHAARGPGEVVRASAPPPVSFRRASPELVGPVPALFGGGARSSRGYRRSYQCEHHRPRGPARVAAAGGPTCTATELAAGNTANNDIDAAGPGRFPCLPGARPEPCPFARPGRALLGPSAAQPGRSYGSHPGAPWRARHGSHQGARSSRGYRRSYQCEHHRPRGPARVAAAGGPPAPQLNSQRAIRPITTSMPQGPGGRAKIGSG